MEAPDAKRPRYGPPEWHNPPVQSQSPRALPPLPQSLPPPPPPYNRHNHPPSFHNTEGPPTHSPHDRRPQEYAHYEQSQQQEPHRPGSGPGHNYHRPPHHSPGLYSAPQNYSAPPLKRDPSEGPLPPQQIYRPSSTSNGSDHNVNPGSHHEPSGRPLPYDSARPDNFQQQSPYQSTHSPMAAPDPYHGKAESYNSFQNNGLPNNRDPSYSSIQYPPPAVQRSDSQSQVRKKAQRAAQACDNCRTLKAKCDEGRPACGSCKEKAHECKYRDPAPKPTDKATADLLDRMDIITNMLTDRFQRVEQELASLKHSMRDGNTQRQTIEPHLKQEFEDPRLYAMPVSRSPTRGPDMQNSRSRDSPYFPVSGQPNGLHNGTRRAMLEDKDIIISTPVDVSEEEEDEEGKYPKPGPVGASTVPTDHKTSATELLLMPAIAQMTTIASIDSKWFKKVGGTGYPFETESRRGTLRLYGRGEGNDPMIGYDKNPMIDLEQDLTPEDSPMGAPSPDGIWDERGQIGGFTPPPHPDYPLREFQRGDINPLGMPDISAPTVRALIQSYQQNINNMHPLLAPKVLEALVSSFLKHIPDGPGQAKPKLPAFIHGGSFHAAESPGNKRKRSPGTGEYPETGSTLPEYKTGHPMRNMTTCIVLLCMALGKICLSEGKISEYLVDDDRGSEGRLPSSPIYRNGNPPSPMARSSSIATPSMGSPHDMDRQRSRSRRASVENSSIPRTVPSKTRNIDRIPGLSYFAIATDIIGNHIGATGLQHVHANILAALYQSQMARVIESAAFLFSAGRGLRRLLEKKRGRFQSIKQNGEFIKHADNPLIFAFWTCLQLESDIIAEMPLLSQSGIMKLEESMPDPNYAEAETRDGFDSRVIRSYAAQLYLRKHLNQLHKMLYAPKTDLNPKMFRKVIDAQIEALTNFDMWAGMLKWEVERGEPASDILGARLRAKFYGAQVITYRFFVLKLLEGSAPPGTSILPDIAVDDKTRKEYASNGLRALIHSTRAFHGLGRPGDRKLLVTNVWGTAHAQWGNMLVLQAAYKSPVLHPLLLQLITFESLQQLYSFTCNFLKSLAAKNSALMVDLKILVDVGKQSGFYRHGDVVFTSSFGSSGVDTPMGGSQQY